jgi:hypothetical protein
VDRFLEQLAERLQVYDADTVSADETKDWPDGKLDELIAAGILAEIRHAKGIICNQCGENHYIEPDIRTSPGCKTVGVCICPDVGRIEIDLNRLRQWQIDKKKLARLGYGKKKQSSKKNNKTPPQTEHSMPLGVKKWADIFGVSENKLREFRDSKMYHFRQVSPRRWTLPKNELPAEYLEKYRQAIS